VVVGIENKEKEKKGKEKGNAPVEYASQLVRNRSAERPAKFHLRAIRETVCCFFCFLFR
jgi:hypothetical protein